MTTIDGVSCPIVVCQISLCREKRGIHVMLVLQFHVCNLKNHFVATYLFELIGKMNKNMFIHLFWLKIIFIETFKTRIRGLKS